MTLLSGRRRLLWYGFAAILAIFTYFYALDSDHVPKNGDEFVYLHITRLTAKSGHWLPLQSELPAMRNTKPPLLFWQGIAATAWGHLWTLERLRLPSVLYSLLAAGLVLCLASKLSQSVETGILGFVTFLAFFGTYRYGRPFLTDAPLTFWLFLPFFVLLYWQPATLESRFFIPLGLGAALGIGMLYKSFALALPVMLCLAAWYWLSRGGSWQAFLAKDVFKLVIVGALAVSIFCLWFILDPDPRAIWKEFVLGENLRKFDPHGGSYLSKLLWGQSSIWRLGLGYLLNAGLLAIPLVALMWEAWQRRRQLTEPERLLWLWVIILFVVFSLPSQRDERYLLPGMPALAVLFALNLHRIGRWAMVATVGMAGFGIGVMAYLSLRLQQGMPGTDLYSTAYWALVLGSLLVVALAIFVRRFTPYAVSFSAVLVSLLLAAFLRPFDGPAGSFSPEVKKYAFGRTVWIPVNFRAKEEGYRFLLPGANVQGFQDDRRLDLRARSARYPLFTARLPMMETNLTGLKIIGQRLDLGSRHSLHQILEMLQGKVFEHLFLKEVLIESPAAGPDSIAPPQPGSKNQPG